MAGKHVAGELAVTYPRRFASAGIIDVVSLSASCSRVMRCLENCFRPDKVDRMSDFDRGAAAQPIGEGETPTKSHAQQRGRELSETCDH